MQHQNCWITIFECWIGPHCKNMCVVIVALETERHCCQRQGADSAERGPQLLDNFEAK
jgi:hypothetical protein